MMLLQVFHKLKGNNDMQPAEDNKQNIVLIFLQNLQCRVYLGGIKKY